MPGAFSSRYYKVHIVVELMGDLSTLMAQLQAVSNSACQPAYLLCLPTCLPTLPAEGLGIPRPSEWVILLSRGGHSSEVAEKVISRSG